MSCSATEVLARCRRVAEFSESTTGITRTFLCPAMHDVHRYLGDWMHSLGMKVWTDPIGNLHGVYPGTANRNRRLLMGSHLDTVPNAGAYDGVLGVVVAIALIELLRGQRLPFAIEIIGFSEEEGVRFSTAFLGSRALVGRVDDVLLKVTDKHGVSIREATRRFGLDPAQIDNAVIDNGAFAYLEFHIEQGPVLDRLNQPLGIVETIAGQNRYAISFTGAANHAGTTPMDLRRDALAGAAEWIATVEAEANAVEGLVATVGAIRSEPQAGNVIPGLVTATLDVRHSSNYVLANTASKLLNRAERIAALRQLNFRADLRLQQSAIAMDPTLVSALRQAARMANCDAPLMTSGAGHDAMILAEKIPSAMLFLRSPGGISHHPDESVLPDDIALALSTGSHFLAQLAREVS